MPKWEEIEMPCHDLVVPRKHSSTLHSFINTESWGGARIQLLFKVPAFSVTHWSTFQNGYDSRSKIKTLLQKESKLQTCIPRTDIEITSFISYLGIYYFAFVKRTKVIFNHSFFPTSCTHDRFCLACAARWHLLSPSLVMRGK